MYQVSITKDEKRKKAGHDKFVRILSDNKDILVREGRCQRVFNWEIAAVRSDGRHFITRIFQLKDQKWFGVRNRAID